MIYNRVMISNEPVNTISQPIVNDDYEPSMSIREMFRAWCLVLGSRDSLESSTDAGVSDEQKT